MMMPDQQSKILFLSTFPPVKCGIASFTQDLLNALTPQLDKTFALHVCALDRKPGAAMYDTPVSMVMDARQLDSNIETAAMINRDPSLKLVCIEHEFGLFGGEMGEYLLGFLALLEKPFVIRFHTVLPSPDNKRLKIVQKIGWLAERVIVMTQHSSRLLRKDYGISSEKIILIPHGTHPVSPLDANTLKRKYRLDNKLVLTTFGLLSPNKGIENGILAMKEISARFPEAVYIVLGHTHPNLLEQEGEKYRDYLQQLIDDNHIRENVRLVNEYVPTRRLMEYLGLTDLYLFTSRDPNQAVSGTFLYAMSAGCPIISNAFVLAEEMLDEETGVIIETGNAQELAANAVRLLGNDSLRKRMGYQAFLRTRNTEWKKVAEKHLHLFYEILGRPAPSSELTPQLIT